MRNPRPEDFSTEVFTRKADNIDMVGVVPLHSKERPAPKQNRADEHAIVPSRQHDGMTASHHDSTPSRHHDGMTAEQISYIFSCLAEKATQKTTVRLPAGLLERLEEVVYEVKKKHHMRLSMNSIFVATLAYFCQEYEKSGEHSSLFEELKKFYDQMLS
ncbi:MAG: hypothetical protein GC179_18430 [Anaerolineaceae bacterium]|nr:hypothetical protein [Anaerolineaceae bacterium]